jgi:hypothetical protein
MIRASRFVAAAALPAAPLSAASTQQAGATAASGITAREIDGHLRFLSHDLLEGRAPATRGGELAAQYIASQYNLSGAVQLSEILLRFGQLVANSPTAPTWNRDAEFRTIRPVLP